MDQDMSCDRRYLKEGDILGLEISCDKFLIGPVNPYLFDGLPFLFLLIRVQLRFQFKYFTLFGGCEVLGIRHFAPNFLLPLAKVVFF